MLEEQLEDGPDASLQTLATEDLDMSNICEDESSTIGWKLKNITGLPIDEGVKMVDFDCVEDRLFVLFSDLNLVEVNLADNEVKRETDLSQVDGA